MAFTFGGIKENMKAKDIMSTDNILDDLVLNHFVESEKDYYIFLLDKFPSDAIKQLIIKKINEAGYGSYFVLNAVDCKYNKDDLHGTGLTDFVCMHRSKWRNYINYKGKHVRAIMAFGPAMYSINGSADIITNEFYDTKMLYPYYYMGHEIFKYDTFIFPVDDIDSLYPIIKNSSNTVNFKTRFFFEQLKNMKAQYDWAPDTTDVKYVVVKSKEEAGKVFEENKNANLVSFDTETNGFKFYENHIHCLTITWDGVTGYYVPWEYVDPQKLADNLMSCKHRTGANPKFDLKFFWSEGVPFYVNVTDATDRAAHCVTSENKSGLKPLSYRYTQFGGYDLTLDKYKKMTKCEDYSKIPVDILSKYATMDAIVTWRCQVELWNQIDFIDKKFPNEKYPEWTIRRWYETQMMEIYKEIARVEYRGIYVNWDLMNKYRDEMKADIIKKEAELRKLWNIPQSFNLYSTTEVGKLFEKMGWECYGRNAAGFYLTNDEAMGAWIRAGKPGAAILAELRTEKTSMNSFLGTIDEQSGVKTGWLQYINHDEKDGNKEEGGSYKVEQSYFVMGTETYRFIGKDPNFQNIPTRNKYAGYVKKCIDTPPADLYTIVGKSGKEYQLAEFELVYTNEGYKTAKECFNKMRTLQFIEDDPDNPPVKRLGFDKQEDGSFSRPDKSWFII